MAAKETKRGAGKVKSAVPASAVPAAEYPAALAQPSAAGSTLFNESVKTRIVLTLIWIYAAALCLLALDQTFNWGIFGPPKPGGS